MKKTELKKNELSQSFFQAIEDTEFIKARNILHQFNSHIRIKKRNIKNIQYIIFKKNHCYQAEMTYLKHRCPEQLKDIVFFDIIEYKRFYFASLLQDKKYMEINQRIGGNLKIYDPYLYYIFGLYCLEINNIEKAKKYLFFSGIYTPETEILINQFIAKFKNGHQNQIIGQAPAPFLSKNTRKIIPTILIEKLKSIGAPKWITK